MKQNKKCTAEQRYSGIGQISDKWILQADDPKVLRQAAADAQLKNKNKHFIGYEIKKLFGVRYLWIFLVLLLPLNSGIAWYTAGRTTAATDPQHTTHLYAKIVATKASGGTMSNSDPNSDPEGGVYTASASIDAQESEYFVSVTGFYRCTCNGQTYSDTLSIPS